MSLGTTKILKSPKSQAKRKAMKNIYKVSFLNEGVHLIHLPPTNIKFGNFTVVYSLIDPIRSKIFNSN